MKFVEAGRTKLWVTAEPYVGPLGIASLAAVD